MMKKILCFFLPRHFAIPKIIRTFVENFKIDYGHKKTK